MIEHTRPLRAVRLIRDSSPDLLATDQTVVVPMPLRVEHGCRSRVAGVRCSHRREDHVDRGSDWRQRCRGCPCTTWRRSLNVPWGDVVVLVLFVITVFLMATGRLA